MKRAIRKDVILCSIMAFFTYRLSKTIDSQILIAQRDDQKRYNSHVTKNLTYSGIQNSTTLETFLEFDDQTSQDPDKPYISQSVFEPEPREILSTQTADEPEEPEEPEEPPFVKPSEDYFNCSNIPQIKVKMYIGHGTSKTAYLGEYNGADYVVILTKDKEDDIMTCSEGEVQEEDFWKTKCYSSSVRDTLKQIFILHRLSHPHIARLYGYCLDGVIADDSGNRIRGVLSVHEYGLKGMRTYLTGSSLPIRLRHALEVANIMLYLAKSPLGSLRYSDYKIKHFVLVDSVIKLIDVDSIHINEQQCDTDEDCRYNIHCDKSQQKCIGQNEQHNLGKLYNVFNGFFFVPALYPPKLRGVIQNMRLDFETHRMRTDILVNKLQRLFDAVQ